MTFGEKLKFYRTENGYSQENLAAELSMDRSAYIYYELDRTLPNLRALLGMSKLYGVTLDEMISGTELVEAK